jgi:hypothetical protein
MLFPLFLCAFTLVLLFLHLFVPSALDEIGAACLFLWDNVKKLFAKKPASVSPPIVSPPPPDGYEITILPMDPPKFPNGPVVDPLDHHLMGGQVKENK